MFQHPLRKFASAVVQSLALVFVRIHGSRERLSGVALVAQKGHFAETVVPRIGELPRLDRFQLGLSFVRNQQVAH